MCPSATSFLADDIFYANALHILTAIEVPIHLFGAYIVLAKTPLKMTSVKKSMITLHVFGAFFDIYLSTIAMPVFTIPFCAGYPLGILLFLGVPTEFQVYIGYCSISVLATSILNFFEDRYFVFVNGANRQKTWRRRAYILFHYILSFLYILPAYFAIPDQTTGRRAIMQEVSCFPSNVLYRPGFFVLALDSTICFICLLLTSSLFTAQLFFFAISIAWKLSENGSKSRNTYRLQKQFMVALSIQVGVPLAILGIPSVYIMWSAVTNYYNQAFTNLAFISLCCHGFISTITMLIVHRPYREAALQILRIRSNEQDPKTRSQIWRTGAGAVGTSV